MKSPEREQGSQGEEVECSREKRGGCSQEKRMVSSGENCKGSQENMILSPEEEVGSSVKREEYPGEEDIVCRRGWCPQKKRVEVSKLGGLCFLACWTCDHCIDYLPAPPMRFPSIPQPQRTIQAPKMSDAVFI